MITLEFVKNLGWKNDGDWNNRMMFSLSEKSNYSIFEHNGDWGIMDPYNKSFALIYCDMTSKMIEVFTELVKSIDSMTENPKNFTLYDYLEAQAKMKVFVETMKNRS